MDPFVALKRFLIFLLTVLGLSCGGTNGEQRGITISGTVYLPEVEKLTILDEAPVTEAFNVELYDSQANLLATTQTESDGSYAFSDVNPETLL